MNSFLAAVIAAYEIHAVKFMAGYININMQCIFAEAYIRIQWDVIL